MEQQAQDHQDQDYQIINDGIWMVVGQDPNDAEILSRWEYWLTLASIVAIPRPVVPNGACMAKVAMIDRMEQTRLDYCAGLIVVVPELKQGDAEPIVSLHDYKLIMQALHAHKKVYTTQPLCAPDVQRDRLWILDSLDPDAPDSLWGFVWLDYKQKFGQKKKKQTKAAQPQVTTQKPTVPG